MKIVADQHIPYLSQYFGNQYELILKPGRAITPHDVKDADILLVRSVTPVNQLLLENASVKFVGSLTAGADHLDEAWLKKVGIAYAFAEGFNAPPVADYVVSVLAALQSQGLLPQQHLRAAIIGVGHVGRLVSKQLQVLGIEAIHCDPLRAKQEPDFYSTSLDEIADVDIISLHVPLTRAGENATYHFIDHTFLKKQKKNAVLINASRGAVIDTIALQTSGKHLQWCLDVFEHEPVVDKQLLLNATITTPHIAGYSVQSKMRGIDIIFKKLCALGFISELASDLPQLPRQQLSFSGDQLTWQSIVLGVFHPSVMTAMMRSILLSADDSSHAFDEMRHQFQFRHEFAYTDIADGILSESDTYLLQGLGFSL